MEGIFNTTSYWGDEVTFKHFKEVFEDCLERGVLKQRGERDSYFVDDSANSEVIEEINVHEDTPGKRS